MALKPNKFKGGVQIEDENSLDLFESAANGSNKISLKAPASLAADVSLTLPDANPSAPAVLQSDSSGNLTWETNIGGSSGVNHIDNTDFETDASGYVMYADTAANIPVDGTGGSATTTFSRVTSGFLRGIASGQLSKDAANRQGEGVSYAFTTEEADKRTVQSIEFDYKTSANFADGDVRVYIYDVTNSQIIEPVPTELLANENSSRFKTYFQTSDSTSYRLILHVASTNASAYTVTIDEVRVGPATRSFGPVVGDWKSFTPSTNLTTNLTATAVKRRVGDMVHEKYTLVWSGATDSASLEITPSESVDTSKLENTVLRQNKLIGSALSHNSGIDAIIGVPSYSGSSGNINIAGGTSGNSVWGNTYPTTIGAGDSISVDVAYPVAGWSSSQQISDDADTRLVAVKATRTSAGNLSGSYAQLTFNNVETDTHGSLSGSVFRAPSSGFYRFTVGVGFSDTGTAYNAGILLLKNGTTTVSEQRDGATSGTSVEKGMLFSDTIKLNNGDTIEVRAFNSQTYALRVTNGETFLSIEKIQGPSQIAANELVACRYTTNAGQAVANATNVTVLFEDIDFDTHGSFNTSTGVFTVPASGKYRIQALVTLASTSSFDAGEYIEIDVLKNAARVAVLNRNTFSGNISGSAASQGSVTLSLVKGDTIAIRVNQNSGGSINLLTSGEYNYVCIERLGF